MVLLDQTEDLLLHHLPILPQDSITINIDQNFVFSGPNTPTGTWKRSASDSQTELHTTVSTLGGVSTSLSPMSLTIFNCIASQTF